MLEELKDTGLFVKGIVMSHEVYEKCDTNGVIQKTYLSVNLLVKDSKKQINIGLPEGFTFEKFPLYSKVKHMIQLFEFKNGGSKFNLVA